MSSCFSSGQAPRDERTKAENRLNPVLFDKTG